MKHGLAVLMFTGFALLAIAPSLEAKSNAKAEGRLDNSSLVVKEAMGMKSRIPQKVLDNAKCVIIIPSVIKGAFGFGGSYGRGDMSCRGGEDFNGPWTYPTMMALEGFSAGLQLGAQATDFVLLVMDERGAGAILSGKFKIGGDAAASAGPIGRDSQANLDIYMRTTILSYSRSRGLFAGVSLEGSTLRPDNRANEELYGKKLNARNIVLENAVPPPVPASAEGLVATLNKYGKSPTENKSGKNPTASSASDPVVAESKAEKQEDIQKVEQQTLQQLYQAQPLAKAAIEKAAGYAVFSDMGIKILFGGSGHGQGVVVNNQTKQKTYMEMIELQAGLGFGISKFRNVFVFRTESAMESFINSGWQFGGQATAGAKTADSGGAMQGAVSVDTDIWMYQLTEEGLNVSVTVTGAKYYKDDSLN